MIKSIRRSAALARSETGLRHQGERRQPLPRNLMAAEPDDAVLSSNTAVFGRDAAAASSSLLPQLWAMANVTATFDRSARTIRRWIRQGYLKPVRVGRAVFFREDHIRRLIADELCHDIQTRTRGASADARKQQASSVGKPLKSERS